MKQYDDLFSYSNFTHIYRDKVIFCKHKEDVFASVWMHLDPHTPIQYRTSYPVSEWDDIKAWSKDKAYALCCTDDSLYYGAVMGMAIVFYAETADDPWTAGDFWKLYASAKQEFDDAQEEAE